MTYAISHKGVSGDVIDVDYCCSQECYRKLLSRLGVTGKAEAGETAHYFWGAWPSVETAYDVHCATCREIMWKGIEQRSPLFAAARNSAAMRGHLLNPFEPLEADRTFAATCQRCGREVVVNLRPAPNEIDIAGEVVALNCDRK
jgi:hypothetical protein